MAHYAILDDNNIVANVIVGRDETETVAGITDWEAYYAFILKIPAEQIRRTSYNTHGNQHANGGVPFRGNYAGIGYTYDETRDAFLPPEPPDATGFDEDTLTWIVPEPSDPEAP
jgi:hypothetical protein